MTWTSTEVLELVSRVGFDPAGICAATPLPEWEAVREWVEEGNHASMAYMARNLSLFRDPKSLLPSAQSIVMVGLNTYRSAEPVAGMPRIARYAMARDYHTVIRSKLKRVVRTLHERTPDIDCRICVDSAPLLERSYAHQAGLGWFGKNTMLIHSKKGSWFMLGALLTSLNLEPSTPAEGGCGTCRACIDACPTGAIAQKHGRWQVDGRLCISNWTIEHRGKIPEAIAERIGDWTFGCDICQDVCPFNQPRPNQPERAQVTTDEDWGAVRQWPSLRQLVQWSEHEWDEATQGSAVRRATFDGLKRNARINLASEPD